MKEELEKQIINIAPYMFRYEGWNDLTKSLLSFGFSHGDGWFNIIKNLVEDLSKIDDELKSIKVIQIKEKFGTLRFYVECDKFIWKQVQDRIAKTDIESETTCEICGKTGVLTTKGWWSVRCNKCIKEKE
jgi:hypothetical protein